MVESNSLFEAELEPETPDPDEIPIKDRRVFTQPYDLVVRSLLEQIYNNTIFLRPISDRPEFQRRYVWPDKLASRLIESILLNVPIPPCYLSQNQEFELDVIDGQQRLYSIYRFLENQFRLSDLEVLKDYNGLRFFELPDKIQRQLETHTIRCVLITNESHPEIKFDVFERLNTNTIPLNPQELRNCIYRGSLNNLLQEATRYEPWLGILRKRNPDKRMRDEELVLRFFAFHIHGLGKYRTPQKHWLNGVAKEGMKYNERKISELWNVWINAIDVSLIWFEPQECFRRQESKAINRALFDLTMSLATQLSEKDASRMKVKFRRSYQKILLDDEFTDLISRAVDHTSRTKRRFEMWEEKVVKQVF
tara:strand:+ start:374 stop:1465 length:1092 start_codon:yes stop_codon:yes gene_type:complete